MVRNGVVIAMKKQDELNLFAMLLERQRRAASGKSEGERQDATRISAADMGHHLGIAHKRIEALTDKWKRAGWWDAHNETPWGFIVSVRGHSTELGHPPCAKFPTSLEAFAGRPAEASVDVADLIDGLITENREQRLANETIHRKQQARFDEVMTSIKSKAAAIDQTMQAPMSASLGTFASDPEQREAVIQHLVAIGQKASPATQEYLARQANKDVVIFGRPGAKSLTREAVVRSMNTLVCQDAMRILREKGMV